MREQGRTTLQAKQSLHQNDELERELRLEEARQLFAEWGMKNWYRGVLRGLIVGIPIGVALSFVFRRLF